MVGSSNSTHLARIRSIRLLLTDDGKPTNLQLPFLALSTVRHLMNPMLHVDFGRASQAFPLTVL